MSRERPLWAPQESLSHKISRVLGSRPVVRDDFVNVDLPLQSGETPIVNAPRMTMLAHYESPALKVRVVGE